MMRGSLERNAPEEWAAQAAAPEGTGKIFDSVRR